MVYICYAQSSVKLKVEVADFFFKQLPGYMQHKILRYRNWEDAQRSLIGKILLLKGLEFLGLHTYSLRDLRYTKFDKPYFNGPLDFNISHSGGYVVCALSTTEKIGIDVEQLIDISISDFEENFSSDEWESILQAEDTMYSFFTHWTQKEAFLKATGMGLNVPLKTIEIKQNKIACENKEWFLYEIKLDKQYVSYLACNTLSPSIILKKFNFN